MATGTGPTKPGRRELSPVIPQALMRYVASVLGVDGAREVLRRAGIGLTLRELHEPERWFSSPDVVALAAAASELTGDGDVGRRAGEHLFIESCAAGAVDHLVALGSIEAAVGGVVRFATKMSVHMRFELASVGDNELSVVATYHASAGRVSPFFCSFTSGYYSMLPSAFGQLGRVVEPECRARGSEHCRYVLMWGPDPRPGPREVAASERTSQSAKRAERQLARFEALQAMATELVQADDVSTALDKITERASVAVHAPRFLSAVRTEAGDALRVHHFGFRDGEEARVWASELLAGEVGEDDGVLVAPVRSARRDYGVLAAIYTAGATFGDVDRRLINAYAGHAAAVLEVVSSLADARRDRDSAHALLELARQLSAVGDRHEMADRLAHSISGVTACDHASVWLWDSSTECITLVSSHDVRGNDAPGSASPGSLVQFSPAEVPEIADMARQPRAGLLRTRTVSGVVKRLLEGLEVTSAAIVPITSRDEFIGILSASFRHDLPDASAEADLLDRLDGIAHYAATALKNADLLEDARHQALHDALTGLPNRTLVEDHARRALARARRDVDHVGLLFVDLDRFKNINDSLGHACGDELIGQVAARLGKVTREGDTLGRLGGDEFTVLLPSLDGVDGAVAVAERVLKALAAPFTVSGHDVFISTSVGIAVAPEHGDDYDTLMRNADAAMYDAKAHGRSTYSVYSDALGRHREQRLELESGLHRAIENNELRVYFQAQTDLLTETPVAVEALVRWEHPVRGLVPPGDFLPIAEESGLIVEIDRWVRRTSFAQGRRWVEAGTPVRVSVNLSTRELGNPQLVDLLEEELAESGLSPSLVELEITDRVEMDPDDLRVVLDRLRSLGVRLAIDDFGTGTSVLDRLQRCPVDTLKIDRAFVKDIIPESPESPVIQALVAMAGSLGLAVVAEGVETELQAEVLRRYGCEVAQGFLYSRPAPAEQLRLA